MPLVKNKFLTELPSLDTKIPNIYAQYKASKLHNFLLHKAKLRPNSNCRAKTLMVNWECFFCLTCMGQTNQAGSWLTRAGEALHQLQKKELLLCFLGLLLVINCKCLSFPAPFRLISKGIFTGGPWWLWHWEPVTRAPSPTRGIACSWPRNGSGHAGSGTGALLLLCTFNPLQQMCQGSRAPQENKIHGGSALH